MEETSFAYYLNMPAFVPIIFEMTVLFAASYGNYLFLESSYFGQSASNPDPRTTDDKFLMEIESDNEKEVTALLKKTGATEINVKELA